MGSYSTDRNGLESTPASRDDQRVAVLQDLLVPPVLLESHLDHPEGVFARQESAQNDRDARVEVRGEFVWNPRQLYADVLTDADTFRHVRNDHESLLQARRQPS